MGYNREVPVNAPCKVISTVTRNPLEIFWENKWTCTKDPHLVYWFDNIDKQIGFKIGTCDVDGSNMSMVERRN